MRLFRRATVADISEPADGFRHITVAGPDLRAVRFGPGQKLQIRIKGFTTRTYTPIDWDIAAGATSILAVVHDAGPGSALLRGLDIGDECQFFGPRHSLDLTKIAGTPVFVGDETSIGLALAWRSSTDRVAHHIFESAHPDATERVLAHLGVHATVVAFTETDELAEHTIDAVRAVEHPHLVLTGRAQSIRRVRTVLKAVGLASTPVMVKAYWDERRAGLD